MDLFSMLAAVQEVVPNLGPLAAFLATYTALFAAVAGIVEVLKKVIVKGWLDGKEQYAAFLLSPGLGALAKWQGIGEYATIEWWGHLVICAGIGATVAGLIHDSVLRHIMDFVKPAAATKKEPKTGKK